MALKQRKQITGTTEQINQYAGVEGQLVWDKSAKTLVGMSGTAGKNYPLAPKAFVTNEVAKVNAEATKKADKTYVDQELAKKQPTGDYATNTQLTQGLAGKANTSHTHAVDDVTDLQVALDGKLDSTAKADSAKVADTANSVAWANVTGKPSIPNSPKAYITETWHSGANWWRKFSDGWIEQGGYINVGYERDYTFNTPFKTTNHTLVGSVNSPYPLIVQHNTTTTFKMYLYDSSSPTGNASWYACGY